MNSTKDNVKPLTKKWNQEGNCHCGGHEGSSNGQRGPSVASRIWVEGEKFLQRESHWGHCQGIRGKVGLRRKL